MFGLNFGVSTSLKKSDNTFVVRIWIWKFCVEIIFNIFLDEDKDGKRDKRR